MKHSISSKIKLLYILVEKLSSSKKLFLAILVLFLFATVELRPTVRNVAIFIEYSTESDSLFQRKSVTNIGRSQLDIALVGVAQQLSSKPTIYSSDDNYRSVRKDIVLFPCQVNEVVDPVSDTFEDGIDDNGFIEGIMPSATNAARQ